MARRPSSTAINLPRSQTRRLARFRYQLRKFLRFSERAARTCGITPLQHQLLLGVAGFTGRGWATVSELADFLQARHNTVVGLIQRAERQGLVRKSQGERDRRIVRVHATPCGHALLRRLSWLHWKEIEELQKVNPANPPQPAGPDNPRRQASHGEPGLAKRPRQPTPRRNR